MRGVGVNHYLRKFRVNWIYHDGIRTSVSKCLYSLSQYDSSAHNEIDHSSHIQCIHRL